MLDFDHFPIGQVMLTYKIFKIHVFTEGNPASGHDCHVQYPGRDNASHIYLPFENDEGDQATVGDVSTSK